MLDYEPYTNRPSFHQGWLRRVLKILSVMTAIAVIIFALIAAAVYYGFRDMARVSLTVINQSNHEVTAVYLARQYPSLSNSLFDLTAISPGNQTSKTIHLSTDEGPCDMVVQMAGETYVGKTAPLLTDNGPFEYTAYVREGRVHIEGAGSSHAHPFDLQSVTERTASTKP